jgi:hypothetical protein
MAEPVEITLAKALKVKNRLAGQIAKFNKAITTYNSVQEGSEQPDVRAAYEARKAIIRHLVDLKTTISLANAPIQRTIYELAELKALVALLNSVSTRHGKSLEGYANNPITYVAALRVGDVNAEVRRLEAAIDRMQDQLDTFNHTVRIRVDGDTLAVADGKLPGLAPAPSSTA